MITYEMILATVIAAFACTSGTVAFFLWRDGIMTRPAPDTVPIPRLLTPDTRPIPQADVIPPTPRPYADLDTETVRRLDVDLDAAAHTPPPIRVDFHGDGDACRHCSDGVMVLARSGACPWCGRPAQRCDRPAQTGVTS